MAPANSPVGSVAANVDLTTRGNLQIREIPATAAQGYLVGLAELGIINRDRVPTTAATSRPG